MTHLPDQSCWTNSARTLRALALAACAIGLAGCASSGEAITSVYVDPAKYELYDCKQLRDVRRSTSNRAAEVQGLMNKAQTGFAGSVVSEIAYRNDYLTARAQYKLADDAWRRNDCERQRLPPDKNAAPAAPIVEPPPLDLETRREGEPFLRRQPDR